MFVDRKAVVGRNSRANRWTMFTDCSTSCCVRAMFRSRLLELTPASFFKAVSRTLIVVKVWAKALVVPAGAAANSVVADADLADAEVDLAEESTPVFVDRKAVVGRTLAQSLRPGQAIRQGHVKTRQWFAVGETVKVVAVGEGFALESVGQAVTNGIEGQPARVRTEGGRIVTGVATGERRLELTL